jgi:hypothetical protein
MDLVVNAPVKAKVRRDRVASLYNQFQSWKVQRLQAALAKREAPPFNPPKPKVVDGLKTLFSMTDTTFSNEQFKESLKRCFVDCCIAPNNITDTEVEFKIYKNHKHGSLNPSGLFGADGDPELGSLGVAVEALDGTLVETRTDAEDRAISDDSGDEDTCSDDESDGEGVDG